MPSLADTANGLVFGTFPTRLVLFCAIAASQNGTEGMETAPRGWAWLEYGRFEVDIGDVWCMRWYDAEKTIRMMAMRTELRLLPP